MPNDYFQFKQFLVKQDRSAFKVGTDGVLLGSWTAVDETGSILDIGTGCGLIALMLAQRTDARIVALEIETASCKQAMENVRISPWKDRIKVVNQSFQDFSAKEPGMFDLIVSNPPFFRDSLKPESHKRNISRHDTMLGLGELISGVVKLLAQAGKFCVILPVQESMELQQLGLQMGLQLHRMLKVMPTLKLPVKRHLLEFRPSPAMEVKVSGMAIEKDTRHDYTEQYRELTRDFYLAF